MKELSLKWTLQETDSPLFLRTAAVNLGLFLVTVLVCFGLLEVGFRLVGARQVRALRASGSTAWAVFDQDLVYRPRWPLPNGPKAGKFRVLVLGDSLLGGRPLIVTVTEAILNRRAELHPTEFINAGVPGYTNYQELLYLEKYGLALHPDLVGVVFCLNDLHKFLHNIQVNEKGEQTLGFFGESAPEANDSVKSLLLRFGSKSYFLMWLRDHVRIGKATVDFYEQHGYTFDYRADFNTAWKDEYWPMIESQMSEMLELGQRNGFRVF